MLPRLDRGEDHIEPQIEAVPAAAGVTTQVAPLSRAELAQVAPNYEAMRTAIAQCSRVDEIADLGNKALAAQAYFRQSQDVENEMECSRMRVRAERRLGELLKAMAESGERQRRGDTRPGSESSAPRLSDLGIPKDRASRAVQLANVPQAEFDAALAEPKVAQPRRILDERKPRPTTIVPIEKTLSLWGSVRDLGSAIESGDLPDLAHWRENLQPFQLEHLRRYVPLILEYLTHIHGELPCIAQAAEIVGVDTTSIYQAVLVKERDPGLFKKLEAGEVTVSEAYDAVKKEPDALAVRRAIRRLAAKGMTSEQMAQDLGISPKRVRGLARRAKVTLPDTAIGRTHKIKARRVIVAIVDGLEGFALGLRIIEGAQDLGVDPTEARQFVTALEESLPHITRLKRRLSEMAALATAGDEPPA